MNEALKEHISSTFAISKQSSEESSVQFELLKESADVFTVQQVVQQGKLFPVTMLYDSNLLLEEGNKCFGLKTSYGFVNDQLYTLPEYFNQTAMYQTYATV